MSQWRPTHKHADGNHYRFVAEAEGRTDNDSPWVSGVIYEGSDGRFWWTGSERWADRFVSIDDYN